MLRRIARRLGTGRALLWLRLVQLPLRMILAALERLVPQDPKLVLFGSPRGRFADNSAYAFLHCTSQPGQHRSVWLTGSARTAARLRAEGLPVLLRWSPAGIWASMRASAFVVAAYRSDINLWFGSRAKVINTWHGVPLKRIERDVTTGPLALLRQQRGSHSLARAALAVDETPPDRLVSASEYVSQRCLQSAFGIDADRIWNIGLPRNDELARSRPGLPSPALVSDTDRWHDLSRRYVIGYFPTWRDDGSSALDGAGLSLDQVAGWVAELGATLVVKPHYNDAAFTCSAPGVVALGQDDDVHAYLPVCDAIITDYSSIGIDFLLTGRPIVYFVPDIEAYRATRGFYFDPLSLMPGIVARTAGELQAGLLRIDRHAAPSDEYLKLRSLLWDGNLDHASADLARLIGQTLSDGSVELPARATPPRPRAMHYASAGGQAVDS